MEPQAQAAMVEVRSIHGMAARRMPCIPNELWQRIYDMNLVAHLGLRVKDYIKAYYWVQGLFSHQHLWGYPWMDLSHQPFVLAGFFETECRNLLRNLYHDIEIVHRQLFELLVQCQFTDGVQRQLLEVPMPSLDEKYDAKIIRVHNHWQHDRF